LVKSALNWFVAGSKTRVIHHPGQGIMPPKGMGNMALNATWTWITHGGIPELETMWLALCQPYSFLELAKAIKKTSR